MAITLTTDPATGSPPTNPLVTTDCLEWCLQPDTADVFTTPGTFATLEVLFPVTCTVPADGTQFTIWGHTFEVDSSLTNSTAAAMKVSATGTITGAAFRQMLNANIFFADNTVVEVHPTLFNLRNTLVTWNACGEQGNFTGANMDVQALIDTGATVTVTNGVTAVQVDGYTMQTRLFKVDGATSTAIAVTEFEGLKPLAGCDDVAETCVNYMKDAARLLYTPMPDLTTTSEIDPDTDTLCARFLLQYGWNYKDANCQPVSGNFYPSDEVFVINAAFDTENKYGIQPYWSLHPDFPPPFQTLQKFLTNQPLHNKLAEHSFAWLWLLNSFTETNGLIGSGTGNPFTLDHFQMNVGIYEVGSAVQTDTAFITYAACDWWQVMNFNVSPQRIADESDLATAVEDIGKYSIQIVAFDAGETEFAFVSEELVFGVEHDCEDNIRDAYFLTPQGGIGTLVCELMETEIVQEGTEICLDTPCTTDRLEAAKYSGRQLANIRNFERVTIKSRQNYGDEWVRYFRSFKASPDRYLMVKDEVPTAFETSYTAKRFNPEPGGIKIFQAAEYIDLIATGTLADVPVQFPKNTQ